MPACSRAPLEAIADEAGAWTADQRHEKPTPPTYCTASRNYATWYRRNFYSVFVVQRICMEVQRSYCVPALYVPQFARTCSSCAAVEDLRMKRAGRDARHKLEISWARSPLESTSVLITHHVEINRFSCTRSLHTRQHTTVLRLCVAVDCIEIIYHGLRRVHCKPSGWRSGSQGRNELEA